MIALWTEWLRGVKLQYSAVHASFRHPGSSYPTPSPSTNVSQKESDLLQEKILALQAEQAARTGTFRPAAVAAPALT